MPVVCCCAVAGVTKAQVAAAVDVMSSRLFITPLPPPSGQFSLFIEPAHHDPIEGIGLVDVAEVVGVWDLLVAGTRYQFGELAHRWFRAVWILGTAERQCRDPNRRELGREVVIHDRRRAAAHPRRCRRRGGVAEMLPTTRPSPR